MKIKKQLLSFLLCFALLLGIFPSGIFTINASAEEVQQIQNIVCRLNDYDDLLVTFDGVAGANDYEVSFYEYYNDLYLAHSTHVVQYEAENSSTITVDFGREDFYHYTVYGRSAKGKPALFYVEIKAENAYGEELARGESDPFQGPFERYLDLPDGATLYGDGIIYFDPVENATNYDIKLLYNGTVLKQAGFTNNNYLDARNIVREGDTYTLRITSYPAEYQSNPWYGKSQGDYDVKYTGAKALGGSVVINEDRSLTYGGYLNYLDTRTGVALTTQWKRFDPDAFDPGAEDDTAAWVNIEESEKESYEPYMLRVEVSAEGHNGTIISNDNTFTDPDDPFIATDYESLRCVFNRTRDDDKTVYIKLGADIEADSGGALIATGGTVSLDFCGYQIDYTGSAQCFMYTTDTGRIILNDSKRYDASNAKWIDGGIAYICTSHYYDYLGDCQYAPTTPTVLSGCITVNGGVYVNNSHIARDEYEPSKEIKEYVYQRENRTAPASLQMYGGIFESNDPVNLEDTGGCSGFYGGEIRVRGDIAIVVWDNAEENKPLLRDLTIVNTSGNSRACAIQCLSYEQYETFFLSASKTYIDTAEQSAVTNGTIFDGNCVYGPYFEDTFEVKTQVVLSGLEFDITRPVSGATPNYTVLGSESELYDVELDWQYERVPDLFLSLSSDALFRSGLWYRAVVTLKPKDGVNITAISGDVIIDGKVADKDGLTFYVNYWIDDTYFDIYIGSTRVGRKNKADVLGDGGSVQFFEAGEYDDGSGSNYWTYTKVLVLNNMNLETRDYHPAGEYSAQLYIDDTIAVVLKGENSLYKYSDHHGICVGNGNYVSFYGDGSLYADMSYYEHDALIGIDSTVSFNENVKITLIGNHGINLIYAGDETPWVALWDGASVTCRGMETSEHNKYPALKSPFLMIKGESELVCDSSTQAISTWDEEFSNKYYSIKISKINEASEPYQPANGLNVSGGVDETDCDYVSIKGYKIFATGIIFPYASYTVTPESNNKKITVTLLPTAAAAFYDNVTFESSDESIATVAKDGNRTVVVTGLKNGTVTLTATAPGGISNTCQIIVEDFEGASVSGSVTSFGDASADITLQLIPQGLTEPAYESIVKGNYANYLFYNVAPGTYTLKVSKAGHNTQEYVLTVGTGSIIQNVTLTQVSSGNIAGDIDCNGLVNTDDVVALLLYISMPDMFPLGSGVVADFTRDAVVNTDDAVTLLLHISMPNLFPL